MSVLKKYGSSKAIEEETTFLFSLLWWEAGEGMFCIFKKENLKKRSNFSFIIPFINFLYALGTIPIDCWATCVSGHHVRHMWRVLHRKVTHNKYKLNMYRLFNHKQLCETIFFPCRVIFMNPRSHSLKEGTLIYRWD